MCYMLASCLFIMFCTCAAKTQQKFSIAFHGQYQYMEISGWQYLTFNKAFVLTYVLELFCNDFRMSNWNLACFVNERIQRCDLICLSDVASSYNLNASVRPPRKASRGSKGAAISKASTYLLMLSFVWSCRLNSHSHMEVYEYPSNSKSCFFSPWFWHTDFSCTCHSRDWPLIESNILGNRTKNNHGILKRFVFHQIHNTRPLWMALCPFHLYSCHVECRCSFRVLDRTSTDMPW